MKHLSINPKARASAESMLCGLGFTPQQASAIYRMRVATEEKPPECDIQFKAKSEDEGEIIVYGEIGFDWWTGEGMDAKWFSDQLKGLGQPKQINVRINSPGGSAFDGMTMHNLLVQHPATIHTHVDGLAASAGSILAVAGDKVHIAENALLMIHDASWIAVGNSNDMRKAAEILDKLDGQIAVSYAAKAKANGTTADQFRALMDEEKWLTGAEALELGLVNVVTERSDAADKVDLSRFQNAPKRQEATEEKLMETVAAIDPLAVAVRLRMLELETA